MRKRVAGMIMLCIAVPAASAHARNLLGVGVPVNVSVYDGTGGVANRGFDFSLSQNRVDKQVVNIQINYENGSVNYNLSPQNRDQTITAGPTRVKVGGTLHYMTPQNANGLILILFDGSLVTEHPTSTTNMIIGAFDLN